MDRMEVQARVGSCAFQAFGGYFLLWSAPPLLFAGGITALVWALEGRPGALLVWFVSLVGLGLLLLLMGFRLRAKSRRAWQSMVSLETFRTRDAAFRWDDPRMTISWGNRVQFTCGDTCVFCGGPPTRMTAVTQPLHAPQTTSGGAVIAGLFLGGLGSAISALGQLRRDRQYRLSLGAPRDVAGARVRYPVCWHCLPDFRWAWLGLTLSPFAALAALALGGHFDNPGAGTIGMITALWEGTGISVAAWVASREFPCVEISLVPNEIVVRAPHHLSIRCGHKPFDTNSSLTP